MSEFNNDLLSIELLLQRQNDLLASILEELQQGLYVKREGNDKKYAARTPLGEDDMDALNQEIDFDAWWETFGESPRPAHYMNFSGAGGMSKQEKDYMFRRLHEIATLSTPPRNEQGTHEFVYVGKVWCNEEKQPRNCFKFKPISVG